MSARTRRHWWAHVETCRPYTLAYPGLAGLAGAALGGHPAPAQWMTAWLAPTLVWAAGLYLGDYLDRELDAGSKPHRPIPSGRLRPGTAVAVGAGCVAVALAVTALVQAWAVAVAVLGAVGVVVYSKVLKPRGIFGNLARGLLTGLVLLFAATVVDGHPVALAWAWACVFLVQDTASNLVGTVRDTAGDRAGGYRTLPVVIGARAASWCAAALFAAAMAAAVALAVIGGLGAVGGGLVLAAVCLGLAGYRVLLGGDPADPRRALRTHEILIAERLVLAAAVASGGLGAPVAVVILVAALAISLSTQALLRRRHEFGDIPVRSA
ncbi:UbiA family prenyltransferase [Nocardia terpenica]|uniref:Ubiquinone biosynthesis protein UbiA n=2 Tax=Nocardia TaxID=1817 RepID=A0A164N8S3_9NOCA|nr:UbiA family prenyltransferase [Nocardia terpenica]KZM74099.1 hypothetical protein AWN90_33415 [Nocardia terpenica]QKQ14792.1 Bra3 [Nocardia terpenica]BAG16277.1 prenyl transferase [Nocardia terpenica]